MLPKHRSARSLACLIWIAFSAVNAHLSAQTVSSPRIITTVAGADFMFPTGPLIAVNAPTGPVNAVATDHNGNVYVSDSGNHMVMKVDANGTLTVFAGNGIAGFSGDGGPATSASLSAPTSLAADNNGNVFIADNGRVRQVSSYGIIATISGLIGVSSIALDQAGNLYGAGANAIGIQQRTPAGAISTVTGSTNLFANAIAVDANGNVYLTAGESLRANGVDGVVYKLGADGPLQTLAQGLNYPKGLRVDAAGNIYVTEYSPGDINSNKVLEVTSSGVTTIAGNGLIALNGDGGPALNSSMGPVDLALDDSGAIFIADIFNSRVCLLKAGIVTTVAGNGGFQFGGDQGPATSAFLRAPSGVAIDSQGNLIIADSGNNRIRLVSPAGIITTIAGNGIADFRGDGGAATAASLNDPQGVAVDAAGNLFIADTGNNRIRKVTPAGVVSTVAGNGNSVFMGGIRYTLSPGYTDPAFSGDGGPATSAPLSFPAAVAVDSSGDVFVAELFRIRKITPDGNIATVAGNGPGVCPPTPFQGYCGSFGGDGGPATSATLNAPGGVAVDSQGNIVVADSGNGRIREVSRQGQINTIVQTDAVTFDPHIAPIIRDTPFGVALDQAGNIYYSDVFFQDQSLFNITLPQAAKIGELTAPGVLTTIAGGGMQGFAGDGGAATGAALNTPTGVAVDANGNIYFCDRGNNRVRVAAPRAFSATPFALKFSALVGQPAPAPLAINLNTSIASLAFAVSTSNASWLSVSPSRGSMPAVLEVSVDPNGLSPGVYTGCIVISSPGAAGSLVVGVTLTVTAPALTAPILGVSAQSLAFAASQGGAATTQSLQILNTGGGSLAFTATVSSARGPWPSLSLESGAATSAAPAAGNSAPLIGSVVHAASAVAGAPIAPGELIAVKGANLASGAPAIQAMPLPLSFNGMQVFLDAQSLPILYGRSGQMNVQVPFTIPVNTTYELPVQNGTAISVPQTVVVAPAQPGIFTTNEQGFGQGEIFKSDDVTLAQPGTAASIGEVVVIYCTGLGAVSPAAPAGQSAPSTPPLATTVNPLSVMIGGQPAQVQFSGLTPVAPGVYQINVAVPSGIVTGDAIPVTISTGGLTSQPGVTMAIR